MPSATNPAARLSQSSADGRRNALGAFEGSPVANSGNRVATATPAIDIMPRAASVGRTPAIATAAVPIVSDNSGPSSRNDSDSPTCFPATPFHCVA